MHQNRFWLGLCPRPHRADWQLLCWRHTSVHQCSSCVSVNSLWRAWRPLMHGWTVTGSKWMLTRSIRMPTRLTWYGSVPNNSLTSFKLPSYLCCLPGWPSRPWFMTLAFLWTASWRWKITYRLCVGPTSGSYVNSILSGRRWRLTPQRHLYMLSSAAVLITVTACCTVSVTVCWRNFKPSRMQLLSGRVGSKKVWPHHAGASSSSLASSPPENQVQANSYRPISVLPILGRTLRKIDCATTLRILRWKCHSTSWTVWIQTTF